MFVICKCFARFFMNTNSNALEFQVGIVVKCFQSERSSGQSLQFPRPTHQNFNFISASSPFSRIFCLFFMTRIQFPHNPSTYTAFSYQSATTNTLQANYPPPCRCRTRSTGFPSASSSLDPFDTVPLSRTHPTPPHTQISQ